MENLVEIDRNRVVAMGGSRYVLVPKALREQLGIEVGDEVVFLRSAEFPECVIRIEKQTPEKSSEHRA